MTNSKPTILGLLRHGQTDWNIEFRLQGTTDVPLNQKGVEQAQQAAAAISAEDWDVVVSSPLTRARQTAELVSNALNLGEIAISELLLERSFGEAEGLKFEDWKRDYPDGHVPGGETLEQLAKRAWELLDQIAIEYPGKRVLAVSHGALIRKLIKLVSAGELPRDGERFQNASLSLLRHENDSWLIHDYSPKSLSL